MTSNDQYIGGCLCGDVRFVASGSPYRVGICHCLDCRKHHGALFHASAIFPEDALTVEGEAWWHDVSAPPPFQTHERGLGAVPVYFVRWSELEGAIADDVLTIGELETLPSLLIGEASFLEHITHNTNQPTNHGHETLVSRGLLEDGRSFEFRYNEKFLPETGEHVFPNVKIEFK